MVRSFGGMVAAGLGRGATFLGQPPWPVIAATLLDAGTLAARLDFRAMLSARWRAGRAVARAFSPGLWYELST